MAREMGFDRHPDGLDLGCTTIIVGGTNGKGSTCAMLESILVQAGYRVATYTSPHLIRFNERLRFQCEAVSDAALIESFERVGGTPKAARLCFNLFRIYDTCDIRSDSTSRGRCCGSRDWAWGTIRCSQLRPGALFGIGLGRFRSSGLSWRVPRSDRLGEGPYCPIGKTFYMRRSGATCDSAAGC